MNHRCGQRHPLRATVLVRRRGWSGWIVGQLENLSVSGAFVRVPAGSLPMRVQVRVEAPCPEDGTPRLVHCDAMVVRIAGGGVGLAFDELAPAGLAPLFRARPAALRPEAMRAGA